MSNHYRILVFGGICSGKTFFARGLSRQLNILPLHLDDVYWYGNWQNVGQPELLNIVARHTTGNDWIVEGNYRRVRELIWRKCTHIFFIDPPLVVTMYRALRRSMDQNRGGLPSRVREAKGAKEPVFGLQGAVLRYWTTKRSRDLAWLREIKDGPADCIVIRGASAPKRPLELSTSL